MANDCLITKLKGTVNNPNLFHLGNFPFWAKKSVISDGESQQKIGLALKGGTSCEIIVNGDGYVASSLANLDNPNERTKRMTITREPGSPYQRTYVYFSNDDYAIEITNPRNILVFDISSDNSIFSVDISKIVYFGSFNIIRAAGKNVYGNLSAFENVSIFNPTDGGEVYLRSSNIEGTLSSLSGIQLITLNLRDTSVSGDIADLLLSSKVAISAGAITLFNTNVSGEILEFVAKQVANNVPATGTVLRFNGVLGFATFNGKDYKNTYSASQAMCMTWESASKIAVYVGAVNIAGSNTVYCYGYTQQEAEAAFSGKTIVRVDA